MAENVQLKMGKNELETHWRQLADVTVWLVFIYEKSWWQGKIEFLATEKVLWTYLRQQERPRKKKTGLSNLSPFKGHGEFPPENQFWACTIKEDNQKQLTRF